MAESPRYRIDFDEWSKLASSDPEGFEALRTQTLDEVIRHAPEKRQHRLRCLQWRVDQARRTSRTPMAACIRISRMMWDSVLKEDGLLERLESLRGAPHARALPAAPRGTATVLPFKPRRDRPPLP
jgi:hypothetical protein